MDNKYSMQSDELESILREFGSPDKEDSDQLIKGRTQALLEKQKEPTIDVTTPESPITEAPEQSNTLKHANATKLDHGWRDKANSPATVLDIDWRRKEVPTPRSVDQNATVVDRSWRTRQTTYTSVEDVKRLAADLKTIAAGNHEYFVDYPLTDKGGESAILFCHNEDGDHFIAKLFLDYTRSESIIKSRNSILEYMKSAEGMEYTLAVVDSGYVQIAETSFYFEITPFCPEGDLSNKTFSVAELVPIVNRVNEALHSLHTFPPRGILHRDIKPENLFVRNGKIVIGDFGVAKVANSGATQHVVGTTGFTAPEVLMSVTDDHKVVFDDKTDYYSLGVTIACLFEGRFVYEGLPSEAITMAVKKGRPPLSRQDPERELLENLVYGLVRYDPAYRFGYNDVCRWLDNHEYKGQTHSEEWEKPYITASRERLYDEKTLFEYYSKNQERWEEAKDVLYGGEFYHFFSSFRPDLASAARNIGEQYRSSPDRGVALYLKKLYPYAPITWKGYSFNSLQELGNRMKGTKTPSAYGELLSNHLTTNWVTSTPGMNLGDETLTLLNQIEQYAESNPEVACYWFGCSFGNSTDLVLDGNTIQDLEHLFSLLFKNPGKFYSTYYGMLKDIKEGAVIYGFLFSLGFKNIIEEAFRSISTVTERDTLAILLSMLDACGQQTKTDCQIVREFFANRGPLATYNYLRYLLNTNRHVYQALDTKAEVVMKTIRESRVKTDIPCGEIYKNSAELIQNESEFRRMLIDNPFVIACGAYENKGILCENLIGCFAYDFLGSKAPLGLMNYIE